MLNLSNDVNDGDDRIESLVTIVDFVLLSPLFDDINDSKDNFDGNC